MMKRLKQKARFYKGLLIEIIETLCTICLYLRESTYGRPNLYRNHFNSHFTVLKESSALLRSEMYDEQKGREK